jgi:hypothetical protein
VEFQILSAGERAVDDRLLEDHAADASRLQRLLDHVIASQASGAAGRLHRGSQDSDRGGLPRSVRSEEREDLARSDLEVDSFEGFDIAWVRLAQIVYFDFWHGFTPLLPAAVTSAAPLSSPH